MRGRISSGKAEVAKGLARVDPATGARTRAPVPPAVVDAFLNAPSPLLAPGQPLFARADARDAAGAPRHRAGPLAKAVSKLKHDDERSLARLMMDEFERRDYSEVRARTRENTLALSARNVPSL